MAVSRSAACHGCERMGLRKCPKQARAQRTGFRLHGAKRGQHQPGVGTIRNAVERCHNFFAQFGRVFRRFDRSARRYVAWIEMAACVILLRSGFVS